MEALQSAGPVLVTTRCSHRLWFWKLIKSNTQDTTLFMLPLTIQSLRSYHTCSGNVSTKYSSVLGIWDELLLL